MRADTGYQRTGERAWGLIRCSGVRLTLSNPKLGFTQATRLKRVLDVLKTSPFLTNLGFPTLVSGRLSPPRGVLALNPGTPAFIPNHLHTLLLLPTSLNCQGATFPSGRAHVTSSFAANVAVEI